MNKHQDPELNKNRIPEQEAPTLPESIMPEIKHTQEEVKGQVLYSSNPEEIGTEQSPENAYKDATNNHLAAISNNEPNWLQKALITRNLANERERVITDNIKNKRQDQNRHADLLTGKRQEDWLKLQTKLEAEKADHAAQKARYNKEKMNGKVMTFITSLGKAVGAVPASIISGWQEVRNDYNKRKNLN